ncbi:MAG: hypothetical protein KA383_10490 [Phycisphaerae bacterium]|jgi:poly(3-hydroxybutyrate) depolymerase|nr:hypothetical protein [Phycisphaerae bacterium]
MPPRVCAPSPVGETADELRRAKSPCSGRRPFRTTDPYDDFGSIDATIVQVSSDHAVDSSRVYAAGFQIGGGMASLLSSTRP